ncbi:MAG TPA: hypothetical protein VFP55_06645, partial [Solirubrobacteraceae bacterium]|nr:hypothetical protein [Solirubrobacteraceae bacterium]
NDLFEEFAGGVWWVDAVQERDVAGLRGAIERGCRMRAEDAGEEALVLDLGSRGPILLVIDNLETVPDAAGVIDPLLEQLPELQVLATSQLPLHSRWERRLPLERLGEEDALVLLDRVAERLGVTISDRRHCVELIGLLDGLPLAIELAAGRLRLFTPAELVRRLRQSAAVLEDRTRPDRHRSLGSALNWTLSLLDSGARELFTRMGVFAGPVELEDVERVVGDGLDVFAAAESLLDASLLHRVESGDGRVRFGFPEAVRQEAARALEGGEADRWRRAHAVWQRDMVWPLRIYEIAEAPAVARAHGVAPETQAALEWAWRNDRAIGRQIALGRYSLASRAGAVAEARGLLERILADPGVEPSVVDLAREHASLARAQRGGIEPSSALMELLPGLRDAYARCLCTLNLAIVLTWEARYDEALVWADRSLELVRQIEPLGEVDLLAVKADTLLEAGRVEDAETTIGEADAAGAGQGARANGALNLIRAVLASHRGRHQEALDGLARVLTDAELAGDGSTIVVGIAALVRAFGRAGREREMLEALGMVRALVDEWGLEESVFADPDPAATAGALGRLGPAGTAMIETGRVVQASQRVKRACALVYRSGVF